MADSRPPTRPGEEEPRKAAERERDQHPRAGRERPRQEQPPEHPDQPEPGRYPGLDGDVFGR